MAVRFTSANQHYTRLHNVGSIDRYAVTCWAKISANRNNYTTFWALDRGNTNDYILCQTSTDGRTIALYSDTVSGTDMTTLSIGTWYYIGVSVNGSNAIVKLKAETASGFSTYNINVSDGTTNITRILLGESSFGGEWLNGCLAGVKLWLGTALTAQELEAEAAQFAPVKTGGLYAYYRFSGPSTADNSGNGHTLSGGSGASQEPDPDIPERLVSTRVHGWGVIPIF